MSNHKPLLPAPPANLGDTRASNQSTSLPEAKKRVYHSKKSHTKSRRGCLSCKSRKVKCNEARPVCNRCFVRDEVCVYATPVSSGSSTSPPADGKKDSTSPTDALSVSSLVKATQASPIVNPLLLPKFARDTTDLKLMWFFMTHYQQTVPIISPTEPRAQRLNDLVCSKIPRLALEFDFLMDCLLAISSLQLYMANGDISHNRCLYLRVRGIERYRLAINNATPESASALTICSLLVANLATELFRERSIDQLCIIDWMQLWRGMGFMISMVSAEAIRELGIVEIFLRPSIDLDEAALHIPSHLLQMVSTIDVDDPDYFDIETYHITLKYLGSLYMEIAHGMGPNMILRIITWITSFPIEFVTIGLQYRPRVLVILAHFLIFMKLIENRWWPARGIGQREIRSIRLYLGDGWEEQLADPIAALSLDSEVDLIRLLLKNPEWEPPAIDEARERLCRLSLP